MTLTRLTGWLLCAAAAVAQTQVDLTRQVRSALPYNSGGTNATDQITARKNVGTVKLVATDFPGADIGAQINNAFAAFGSAGGFNSCGTVMIPAGTFTYGTTINLGSGCQLEGMGRGDNQTQINTGTHLVYAGAPATVAVRLANGSVGNASYTRIAHLSLTSNAGLCPNNGMLAWNAGAAAWQCYDGTTYTAAIPHLAGIQHGNIDPANGGSSNPTDGIFNLIEDVKVDTAGGINTQGAFHFGIWLNGCEHCTISATDSEFNDDGFYFGPFSGPLLLNQTSAQLNRRSGYHARGFNHIQGNEALAQSNEWWGHQGADPTKYGAGWRFDNENLPPGFGGFTSAGVKGVKLYFENNDVDVMTPPGFFAGPIEMEGFQSIRGGYSNSIFQNCVFDNASNVSVGNQSVLEIGCAISAGTVNRGAGSNVVTYVSNGQPTEIDQSLTAGTAFNWKFNPYAGSPPQPMEFTSTGAGGGGVALQLDASQAATSSNNVWSPAVQMIGNTWNGTSSQVLQYLMEVEGAHGSYGDGLAIYAHEGNTVLSTFAGMNNALRIKPTGDVVIDGSSPSLFVGGDFTGTSEDPKIFFNSGPANGTNGGHIQGSGTLFLEVPQLVVKDTMQIAPSGSQPTCNASNRFVLWTTAGAAGVKDSVQVCAKDAADTYSWRTIY